MLEDIAMDFFEKDLRSFQSKTKIHIAEDELEEMLVTACGRRIERGGRRRKEEKEKIKKYSTPRQHETKRTKNNDRMPQAERHNMNDKK